jgi:RND family efflux transporter MFP subunit
MGFRRHWGTGVRGGLLLAILVLSLTAAARGQGVEAVTAPSKDVQLSFTRPGKISAVVVKEGDRVEADDLLARQDDAAERVRVAKLKLVAEDETSVRAGKARLAQKKVDLQRLEKAFKEGVATEHEVENARLDVLIAELSLELARIQRAQDRKDYEEAKIVLERMQLRAPFAGRVEEIAAAEGESVDAQEDVVRLVRIDPIWIDVPVPQARAAALSVGRTARIEPIDGVGKAGEGRIIFKAGVGDAASGTLLVRVEVPNPAGEPAGRHVRVNFPEPAGGAEGAGADEPNE